jgi:hypothetical protein
MTNEKPITIDADAVRRMKMNAERNPRVTLMDMNMMFSVVNPINPVTGRPYEKGFMLESERRRIKKDYSLNELNSNKYIKSLFSLISQTTQTIELQKALGRMEVREGKLPELFYEQFLDDIDKLADLYAQSPDLTLESITDVNGLNTALRVIRRRRFAIEIERNEIKDNYCMENFRNAIPVKEEIERNNLKDDHMERLVNFAC